jgi:hypothetical protein
MKATLFSLVAAASVIASADTGAQQVLDARW